MLIDAPRELMVTLFGSMALTVGVIMVLFVIAFRSFRLGLAGMMVNLLPVIYTIGFMAVVGIPADVTTAMVGSVAFGLSVDDTFHYLYHFKKYGSIVQAASVAGEGIVATSFMLAAGLLVLVLSGFIPVVRFGWLTSLAVLTALVIDATVLPALVGKPSKAIFEMT